MKLTIKTGILILAASVAALGLAAQGQAFEAAVSGQVNQLFMYANDGEESDYFIADNDNSSTRFRLRGKGEFDWGEAAFRIELEAERNSSSKLSIPNEGDGSFNFGDRWLEASFKTDFGMLSIGKGDGAANNTSETDLSGTSVIMYSGVNDTAADFNFREDNTGAKGPTIDATRDNFDGLSRNSRIRYDTPTFFGTSLAGSATNGSAWEVAAFYANEFGGNKIAASAGYVNSGHRGDRLEDRFNQFGISASWLAPFGLNLTAAYGRRDFTGPTEDERKANGQTDDATNYYGKIGYKFAEIHAFAVEYGLTQDLDVKDDKSSNYGAAYVVKPWDGVELYASGRLYRLDRDNVDFKDFYQVMGGTRIKF